MGFGPRNIEDRKGRTSPDIITRCTQYAQDVFRSKIFAPWLYVYCAVSGEFREGWVPDNYYGKVVVPRLNGSHGALSRLKSISAKILPDAPLPDVAYAINGRILDTSYQVLSGDDQILKTLFADDEEIVFKQDDTAQGSGVSFFDRRTWSSTNAAALGNGVFQRRIMQHPFFASFGSNAVATLRLTTLSDVAGHISLRAAYLRFGSRDDLLVLSGSNVRVPINLKTGGLASDGYLSNWGVTANHPASGKLFAGETVPGYAQCVDTVIALHQRVPFVGCIGWDGTVNRSGAVELMEWNAGHNGISFTEAVQGPCFADQRWERLIA